MKIKLKYFSLFFIAGFLLTAGVLIVGCSKRTYTDALPQVQFLSVVPYQSDSLIITGKVVSQGASSVENVGFAYDRQSSFSILKNQVLLNGTSSQFSAIILGYQDSTYYFKAFATNSFGYSESTVFKYTVPTAGGQSAPCNISNNTILDNNVNYSFVEKFSGTSYATYGSFGVEADDAQAEMVNLYFNQIPANRENDGRL